MKEFFANLNNFIGCLKSRWVKKVRMHNARFDALEEAIRESSAPLKPMTNKKNGYDWEKVQKDFDKIEYSEELWEELVQDMLYYKEVDQLKELCRKSQDIDRLIELENDDVLDLRVFYEELYFRFLEERNKRGLETVVL